MGHAEGAFRLPDDPAWAALVGQADLILADATREIAQTADTQAVQAATRDLKATITAHRTRTTAPP